MQTLHSPAPPDNLGTPLTNARTPGDIREPILKSLDDSTAAWRRLQHAQVEAQTGRPDSVELSAARAAYEATQVRFLAARVDMNELFLGMLRNAHADPVHACLAAAAVAKLAGVPDLEQIVLYFGRRLDAVEARSQSDRDRVAELEDSLARRACDRPEAARLLRTAVTA